MVQDNAILLGYFFRFFVWSGGLGTALSFALVKFFLGALLCQNELTISGHNMFGP